MIFVLLIGILIIIISSQQIIQTKQPWVPKIIWTWWQKKILVNDHNLKLYQINHELYSKGWQLRHLDEGNQQFWFSKIPDYNNILHSEQFKNTNIARKSNLVALLLIKHFGGIYIDYTMLLTQPLDWVINIEKQKLVTNKFGDYPDVLLLHNNYHGSYQITNLQKDDNGNPILIKPTFEGFVIAAKPRTLFMQLWYQKFIWARNQSYRKWGNQHMKTVATEIAKQNNIQIGGFVNAYWEQGICALILTQMKQQQFDREWEKDKAKPRQFAVKHFNIWSLPTKSTVFSIQQSVNFNNYYSIRKYFQFDIAQLLQQKSFPKYFVKFYGQNKNQITNFWLNSTKIRTVKCPIQNYILENSLAYQFALKNYPIKFYSNPVVKKIQDIDCTKIQSLNPQFQAMKLNVLQIKMKYEQIKLILKTLTQQIQVAQVIKKNQQTNFQKNKQQSYNNQIISLNKQLNDKIKEKQGIISQFEDKFQKIQKQLIKMQNQAKNSIQNKKMEIQNLKKEQNQANKFLKQSSTKIQVIEQQIKNMKKQLQTKQKQNKQDNLKINQQVNEFKQNISYTASLEIKQAQKNKKKLQYIKQQIKKQLKKDDNEEKNQNTQKNETFITIYHQQIYLSIIFMIIFINFVVLCCMKFKRNQTQIQVQSKNKNIKSQSHPTKQIHNESQRMKMDNSTFS